MFQWTPFERQLPVIYLWILFSWWHMIFQSSSTDGYNAKTSTHNGVLRKRE